MNPIVTQPRPLMPNLGRDQAVLHDSKKINVTITRIITMRRPPTYIENLNLKRDSPARARMPSPTSPKNPFKTTTDPTKKVTACQRKLFIQKKRGDEISRFFCPSLPRGSS